MYASAHVPSAASPFCRNALTVASLALATILSGCSAASSSSSGSGCTSNCSTSTPGATQTTVTSYYPPYDPTSVAIDASGNLYVGDVAAVVHKYSFATNLNTNVAGNGTYGYSGDGYLATQAELSNVYDVAIDANGNLYIDDRANRVVRRVDAKSGYISTYVGMGYCANNGDGGLASQANVCTPEQVAVDSTGTNLYVTDLSYGQVRKVNLATNIITTVAGNNGGTVTEGIPATSALLTPDSIALDAAGNLYIGDHNRGNIRKVTAATGLINTIAGAGNPGVAIQNGDGGPALAAYLSSPLALAVNSYGTVYVNGDSGLRRIDSKTGIITSVANVTLGATLGMNFDSSGNLFVADNGNRVIVKITGLQ